MSLNNGFCGLFRDIPAQELIANDRSEKRFSDDLLLSYAQGEAAQAWTVSLYAALVQMGRDELVKLPRVQAALLRGLIAVLAAVLRLGKIDKTVGVQNFGLSTNLYDAAFLQRNPADLRAAAQTAYPRTAVLIRSLNATHHQAFMDNLAADDWQFLLMRQIYLSDSWAQIIAHRDSRHDIKLMADGRYRFRRLAADCADADFQAAQSFYNQLYLNKYSLGNVQFTARFMRETVSRGLLDLYLLERVSDGAAVGCIGVMSENGILAAPVLGYNLALPQSEGLYRRLSMFIAQYGTERGLRQHWSSGAPQFKKSRGAVAELEYTAVYTRHLPFYQRAVWALLVKLSNGLYRKILEENEL